MLLGVPTFNQKISYTKLFENKRRRSVIFENKEDNKNLSNPPAEGVEVLVTGRNSLPHKERELEG